MKRFLFLISLVLLIGAISCTKKDDNLIIPYDTVNTQTQTPLMNIYGTWTLIDASIYVQYSDGEKVKYSCFSNGQTVSGLRLIDNNGVIQTSFELNFEKIEKNVTTWEFISPASVPGCGKFILNSDYINPYGFNVSNSYWSIINDPTPNSTTELIGARSIRAFVKNLSQKTCNFYLQTMEGSLLGRNCTYFSELVFQKQ